MANWPATLPEFVLQSGFSETLPNSSIRTSMDVGPAKIRRRTSASVRPISATVEVTMDQCDDIDQFYADTLEGGSLEFTWVNPRTAAPCNFRFTSPPRFIPVSGIMFHAQLSLEQMP